jgi:hypothetical protein
MATFVAALFFPGEGARAATRSVTVRRGAA